ncbi:MAG: phosphotransferase [Gammaproteobacteria bacterium]|jgi:hygromycin-B 4-O-kinase
MKDFLSQQMHANITNLQKLSSGMFSQAYSFVADKNEYVLRLNKFEKDFKKDIYAYQNFGDKLLIPKILKHGKYNNELYYAITLKCKGVTHDKIKNPKNILPEIIKIIETMRAIDVTNYRGFGLLDENGQGQYDSWREAIMSFYNHKFPNIEIKKFINDAVLEKIFNLLEFIPETKYLVHGDFGFDNLVVDNDKITGVLDWAESKYGDFLYDVAWLDFWSDDIKYARIFKNYYTANKIEIPNFDERIECYRLHIGLSSLILAAYLDNQQDYEKIKRRMNDD